MMFRPDMVLTDDAAFTRWFFLAEDRCRFHTQGGEGKMQRFR